MRAVDEQPPLQALPRRSGVPSTDSSTPIIAPLTRTSWISGQRACSASKRSRKLLADLHGALEQAVRLDGLDGGQGGAAGERVAAERGRVRAGLSFSATSGLATRPPQRDAAGQRLGQRHDVRLHVPVLVGVPLAGAAHAGLHLVEDQQQLVLVGQLAQPFEVASRRQVDAALALDRLDQDGAGLAVDQLGRRRRGRRTGRS